MSSISKPDHCMERPSLVLLSAYQEYLMIYELMTSQVVKRARPLITHICVIGAQRVNGFIQIFFSEQNLFKLRCETVIRLVLCYSHQVCCFLYYFCEINNGIHIYHFTFELLYFCFRIVVSDLNKNIGGSTD